MQRFAGIFFHVRACQVNNLFNGIFALAQLQHDLATHDDGVFELADLVTLGQIRVEIVLTGKDGVLIDLGANGQAKADGAANGFAIHHGQHTRHGQVDQAGLHIRLGAEGGGCPRKDFRLGGELGMRFDADDNFPGHNGLSGLNT